MRYLLMLLFPFIAACFASFAFADEVDQQDISYMADWPKLAPSISRAARIPPPDSRSFISNNTPAEDCPGGTFSSQESCVWNAYEKTTRLTGG